MVELSISNNLQHTVEVQQVESVDKFFSFRQNTHQMADDRVAIIMKEGPLMPCFVLLLPRSSINTGVS